jgi:hypothetical protein
MAISSGTLASVILRCGCCAFLGVAAVVGATAGCDLFDSDDDTISIRGTIEYSPLEGGCWLIVASDQTRYEPVDLPDEYRTDGLCVLASLRPVDVVTVCMMGTPVEVVEIAKCGGVV